MRLNININSDLTSYIDKFKEEKSTLWYIVRCIKYCRDNNIDLKEYYEGIDNDRTEKINRERKSRSTNTVL